MAPLRPPSPPPTYRSYSFQSRILPLADELVVVIFPGEQDGSVESLVDNRAITRAADRASKNLHPVILQASIAHLEIVTQD